MLPLYLLAAHLVGDFILQTRWQAAGKFARTRQGALLRLRHVATYSVPFVPLAIVYGGNAWWSADFMLALFLLHYLTDSRRFTSTLGDWVAWYVTLGDDRLGRVTLSDPRVMRDGTRVRITTTGQTGRALYEDGDDLVLILDLEPNPWTPVPIMIDQTLHVCQIALLGGLFLA